MTLHEKFLAPREAFAGGAVKVSVRSDEIICTYSVLVTFTGVSQHLLHRARAQKR